MHAFISFHVRSSVGLSQKALVQHSSIAACFLLIETGLKRGSILGCTSPPTAQLQFIPYCAAAPHLLLCNCNSSQQLLFISCCIPAPNSIFDHI
eukprot:1162150-Pelagomonas_calceolata.AAC.4